MFVLFALCLLCVFLKKNNFLCVVVTLFVCFECLFCVYAKREND